MNGTVKLEHYVPRFYLNSFAVRPKKSSVYCYDKTKNQSFLVSTKNVASEGYFYDVSENQELEKHFSDMESLFVRVYRKILSSGDLERLGTDDKEAVAFFAAAQELRTREMREVLKDIGKQMKARLSQVTLTDEFKSRYDFDAWGTEEEGKALQLSGFGHIADYAGILLQMRWILVVNRSSVPFWTSDHPVNRFNPIDMRPRGNLGLISRGIQIHYPLSPKVMLVFCDPTSYDEDGTIQTDDLQHVMFENSLQVTHSTRYLFSNRSDWTLAEQMLSDDPSLRDIHRKRLRMN